MKKGEFPGEGSRNGPMGVPQRFGRERKYDRPCPFYNVDELQEGDYLFWHDSRYICEYLCENT